jgi:uncharacterized repeat protein (TIGR01451 family)
MISNLPNKFISGNIAHYLTSFNCLKFNFSRFFLNTGQMFILSLALIVNSTSSIAGSNSEFFNIRNGFFVSPRNGNSFFYNSGEIIPITYQAFAATLTVNMSQSGGPNPVTAAGDIIDYTIIIENTGDQIITGVTVTDVLPDGSDVILSGPTGDLGNIGDLDIGETWTYTISYTVTQDDMNTETNLTNTVSVVSVEYPGPTSDFVTKPVIPLKVDMTQSGGPNPVTAAGVVIDYNITVQNTGGQNITGVTATDVLPDGSDVILSGPTGDLGNIDEIDVGETWTYTISYTVTQGDMNTGNDLINTVSVVTVQIPGPTQVSSLTLLSQNAALTIVKEADKSTVSSAGETINYTITVDNTGNVNLTNVVLTDVLAGGATLASGDTNSDGVLDVGETWIYTADYEVIQANIDAGTDIVNSASVDTDQTDPLGDDATTTIQNAALTIVKEADKASVSSAGETINYTITVDNTGNVNLTNVVLTDVLAGGATLASGDTNSDGVLDVAKHGFTRLIMKLPKLILT